MWQRISEWLAKVSTGWVTAIFTLIFLVFTATVLPAQSAKADLGDDGVGSPDLSFFYSVDQLYTMAESYGEIGRAAYIRARFSFDVIWPLVYTAFLGTALSWTFSKAFGPSSKWQPFNLAPILAMLFDFLENSSTSLVMARYPSRTLLVDNLAPFFTAIKWVWVYASFGLLIIGGVVGILRWGKEKPYRTIPR